jgi:replicative DNA helicase
MSRADYDRAAADDEQRWYEETGGVADWDWPVPLTREALLPSFPLGVFPSWLREFVEALSVATQTPTDLGGMLALAALSTAASGRVVVEVRPGWREPVNLFCAVAMPPGNRKSPVLTAITGPLVSVDKALTLDSLSVILEAETLKMIAENAARAKARTAADNPDDSAMRDEAVAAAAMAEAVTVPASPRLLADDCTPEALASLMSIQGGRIATLSDEGGVFDLIAGRYSGMANLDLYLKGHSGTPHRVDRKGRPAEFIERPALTMGLAVQPEVLRAIADRPGFRGRGLLARFLYALPLSPLGRRAIAPPPVATEVQRLYGENLQALVRSLVEWTDPAILTLSPEAAEGVVKLETAIEPRLGPGGDLAPVADWASKLVGQLVRVAALVHLATHLRDGWARDLGRDTIEAAGALTDYFIDHALAAFELMAEDSVSTDAVYVLRWLDEHDRDCFVPRDLYTANRSRFPTADSLGPVLKHLEDFGWIRPLPEPERRGPGRPASRPWLINPLIRQHNQQKG